MVSNNFQESKKVGTFSPKMNNWRENPLQYYFNKNKISPGWQRTKDEKNGLLNKNQN